MPKVLLNCVTCKEEFSVYKYRIGVAKFCSDKCKRLTDDVKEKARLSHLGKKQSPETVAKRIAKTRGMKRTLEFRNEMSERAKLRVKNGTHNFYKGGISPINKLIRMSIEYRLWRESVFARDNWTCQECKQRGGELHPHHIKSFAYFPELRFAIDNGITLCAPCHKKTDTYGKWSHSQQHELLQTQLQQQALQPPNIGGMVGEVNQTQPIIK